MIRATNLYPQISEMDNLRLAFCKARKGKSGKREVLHYQKNLDTNLAHMRHDLLMRTISVGDYHFFKIHDPKERRICAAKFPERVLHHAIMNICEPIFERTAIFDTYACRKGKGTSAAVDRAVRFGRGGEWFLKLDIRKYFDSISHRILLQSLAKKFKEPPLLKLFERVIQSYFTRKGHGLPIGNLTSQFFANFYLDPLDRFIKNTLRVPRYIRYMDDFILWGKDRYEVRAYKREIATFVSKKLNLKLNEKIALNRTTHGVDFLGYRLYPNRVRLSRRSKRRAVNKYRIYEWNYCQGHWNELELQTRMVCLFEFMGRADFMGFRRALITRFGVISP